MTKVNFKTLWSLRVTKCYLYNTSGPHDPSINLWDNWIAVLSSRSLKRQKCMFPGWWRPEVHDKGISRVTVPLRLWVEFFFFCLFLTWLLVSTPGAPQLQLCRRSLSPRTLQDVIFVSLLHGRVILSEPVMSATTLLPSRSTCWSAIAYGFNLSLQGDTFNT